MYKNMIQAMFKNHPARQEVLGTKESVYSTTKEDLYTCYETFYHPENMILFIAGNFDAPKMMKLIKDNQTAKSFPVMRDRKSTRLNSSHVAISYAVFCLKKKKNK